MYARKKSLLGRVGDGLHVSPEVQRTRGDSTILAHTVHPRCNGKEKKNEDSDDERGREKERRKERKREKDNGPRRVQI